MATVTYKEQPAFHLTRGTAPLAGTGSKRTSAPILRPQLALMLT